MPSGLLNHGSSLIISMAGSGKMECPECNGRSRETAKRGIDIDCPTCSGTGEIKSCEGCYDGALKDYLKDCNRCKDYSNWTRREG